MGDKMDSTIEALECIVSGLDMGINAIDELIEDVNQDQIKRMMAKQNESYKHLKQECEEKLKLLDRKEENHHEFETWMAKSMIKMKTMMNKDSKSIAKMLIEGSNKAIISMHTLLNEKKDIAQEVIELSKQFIQLEKEHIHEWEPYL